MEENNEEAEIKERFAIIGPIKTIVELVVQLNTLNEGTTRVITIQKERSGYFAIIDRALQMIVTPDDYFMLQLDQNKSNSDTFVAGFDVKMA